MNFNDGDLTKWMRKLAIPLGLTVAYGSAKLSVVGIGLGGDLWWMSWVIALSLFMAEFVVNGKHEETNWTILIIGTGAYVYSIWTNIAGVEVYKAMNGGLQGTYMEMVTIYAGGFFLDVFPEMAIRWGMGESRVGDFFGNIVKTVQHPEVLTGEERSVSKTKSGYSQKQTRYQSKVEREEKFDKLRKNQSRFRPRDDEEI